MCNQKAAKNREDLAIQIRCPWLHKKTNNINPSISHESSAARLTLCIHFESECYHDAPIVSVHKNDAKQMVFDVIGEILAMSDWSWPCPVPAVAMFKLMRGSGTATTCCYPIAVADHTQLC